MQPYAQGKRWTLYAGDCLALRHLIPATAAIVTDPPYGINAVTRGRAFGSNNAARRNEYLPIAGDDQPFDPSPWLDYPIVVLFGANHYASRLPDSPGWLVWDKRDGHASNPLADCEMAWTNQHRPARLLSHRWMGMVRDSEHGPRLHPSQKPVALMAWALDRAQVPPGALVADPYCGAGATGVAVLNRGGTFTGIEREPAYLPIIARRLAAAEAGGVQLELIGGAA
jgi:site-specific DNA-methyltransferase (adenine-specific)